MKSTLFVVVFAALVMLFAVGTKADEPLPSYSVSVETNAHTPHGVISERVMEVCAEAVAKTERPLTDDQRNEMYLRCLHNSGVII